MKRIEQDMLRALVARKPWHRAHTAVRPFTATETHVYLHGHQIATVTRTHVHFTLAGWPTVTTRSRINAVLRQFTAHSVYQHKDEQYYSHHRAKHGLPLDLNQTVSVRRIRNHE